MKRITERILLVVLVVIGLLIMLLASLVGLTANAEVGFFGVTATNVMFVILAVLYVGISIYLIYDAYSNVGNVRRLTVYADKDTTVRTTVRVVKRLVLAGSQGIEGIKIKKVNIYETDKGASMRVKIEAAGEVKDKLDKLREQIAATFLEVLNVKFLTVDFDVCKIKYTKPTTNKTEQNAQEQTDSADKSDSAQRESNREGSEQDQSNSQDGEENPEQNSEENTDGKKDSQPSIFVDNVTIVNGDESTSADETEQSATEDTQEESETEQEPKHDKGPFEQ